MASNEFHLIRSFVPFNSPRLLRRLKLHITSYKEMVDLTTPPELKGLGWYTYMRTAPGRKSIFKFWSSSPLDDPCLKIRLSAARHGKFMKYKLEAAFNGEVVRSMDFDTEVSWSLSKPTEGMREQKNNVAEMSKNPMAITLHKHGYVIEDEIGITYYHFFSGSAGYNTFEPSLALDDSILKSFIKSKDLSQVKKIEFWMKVLCFLYEDITRITNYYNIDKKKSSSREELKVVQTRYLDVHKEVFASIKFWRPEILKTLIERAQVIYAEELAAIQHFPFRFKRNEDSYQDLLKILNIMHSISVDLNTPSAEYTFFNYSDSMTILVQSVHPLLINLFNDPPVLQQMDNFLITLELKVKKLEEEEKDHLMNDVKRLRKLGLQWRCAKVNMNVYKYFTMMLLPNPNQTMLLDIDNEAVSLWKEKDLLSKHDEYVFLYGYVLSYYFGNGTLYYKNLDEGHYPIQSVNVVKDPTQLYHQDARCFSDGSTECLYYLSETRDDLNDAETTNKIIVRIDPTPLRKHQPPLATQFLSIREDLDLEINNIYFGKSFVGVQHVVNKIDESVHAEGVRHRIYDIKTKEMILDQIIQIPLPSTLVEVDNREENIWSYYSVSYARVVGNKSLICFYKSRSVNDRRHDFFIVQFSVTRKFIKFVALKPLPSKMISSPECKWITLRGVPYCIILSNRVYPDTGTDWLIVALHRNRIIDVSSGELEIYCSFDYFDERTRSFMTLYQETKSSSGRTDLNDTLHKVVFKLCYN